MKGGHFPCFHLQKADEANCCMGKQHATIQHILHFLQQFSTLFFFLGHPRLAGGPDGYRSKAITIFT